MKKLLLVLFLVGCSSVQTYSQVAVAAYCGRTPEARAMFRAVIASSTYPNKVVIECVEDQV